MDWQREEISFKLFQLSRLGGLLRGEIVHTKRFLQLCFSRQPSNRQGLSCDHARFSMLTKQISKISTVLKALRSRGKNVVDPVEEEGYDD